MESGAPLHKPKDESSVRQPGHTYQVVHCLPALSLLLRTRHRSVLRLCEVQVSARCHTCWLWHTPYSDHARGRTCRMSSYSLGSAISSALTCRSVAGGNSEQEVQPRRWQEDYHFGIGMPCAHTLYEAASWLGLALVVALLARVPTARSSFLRCLYAVTRPAT